MMYVNTIIIKIIFNLFILSTVLIVLYFTFIVTDRMKDTYNHKNVNLLLAKKNVTRSVQSNTYNVWLILTKVVTNKSTLMLKFKRLILNVLNVTSVPIYFHIFVDRNSKRLIDEFMNETSYELNTNLRYSCYLIEKAASLIEDIVSMMTPHFSSKPGTYYSDALFYLSLGLHRIAPKDQNRAIMLDCDLYLKEDLLHLFQEFDKFKQENLFGLAPELTPVYRHVLHKYRTRYKTATSFGDYLRDSRVFVNDTRHPYGYQGYNSGVILIDLEKLRSDETYSYENVILNGSYVNRLANEYQFKGHLGDQDFYTLLGYVRPELIYRLECGYNRQLCEWWKDHGYKDVFYNYFKCDSRLFILHGNCNTKIPV